MKKTAIALVVAAFAAAPAMAEVKLSGTVGAKIEVSGTNGRVNDANGNDNGVDETKAALSAGDVNLNIAATHDMGNGNTAYGNMRFDVNSFSSGTAVNEIDSVKLGVKGGFGDLAVGDVGSPYFMAADMGWDEEGSADTVQTGHSLSSKGIRYTSPEFGAGKWQASIAGTLDDSADPNSDVIGAGVKGSFGGFNVAGGVQTNQGVNNEIAMAVGAGYSFANGASVAIDYETLDDSATTGLGKYTSIGVGAGASVANFDLNAWYGTKTLDANGTKTDTNMYRLQAKRNLGGGLSAGVRYQKLEVGGNSTLDGTTRIFVDKAF